MEGPVPLPFSDFSFASSATSVEPERMSVLLVPTMVLTITYREERQRGR